MNENEVSSIFTLERKGQLDRDISVVTAVSVDYLNALLNDIINQRNEASALYSYISQQNYNLSVDGILNIAETIRQLYDNNARLKTQMIENDNDMQNQLNKLNYYMFNSSINNSSGYDIVGKVDKLINESEKSEKLENKISQTLYKFNSTDIKITRVPVASRTYELSNVFLSVMPIDDNIQEFSFIGKGNLGCFKAAGDACDNELDFLDGRSAKTYVIPCRNSESEAGWNYSDMIYLFSSPNCQNFNVIHNIYPVQSIQTVNINNSTSSLREEISVVMSAYPYYAGYVEGTGVYDISAKVKIHAVPYSGYTFSHWAAAGTDLSVKTSLTADAYRVIARNAAENIAVFEEQQKKSYLIDAFWNGWNAVSDYMHIVSPNIISSWTTPDGGVTHTLMKYNAGDFTNIKCDLAPCQRMSKWIYYSKGEDSGESIGTRTGELSSEYAQFTVTENCTLQVVALDRYQWKYAPTMTDISSAIMYRQSMLNKGYNFVVDSIQSCDPHTPAPTKLTDAMINKWPAGTIMSCDCWRGAWAISR